jgi:hypothetical protein
MMEINDYVVALHEPQKERVTQVINYIRQTYPDCIETMDYTPKYKFPVFIEKESYIGVAGRDKYMTLHFGRCRPDKPEPYAALGYVNIQDEVPLPLQEIKQTVDFCFGNYYP